MALAARHEALPPGFFVPCKSPLGALLSTPPTLKASQSELSRWHRRLGTNGSVCKGGTAFQKICQEQLRPKDKICGAFLTRQHRLRPISQILPHEYPASRARAPQSSLTSAASWQNFNGSLGLSRRNLSPKQRMVTAVEIFMLVKLMNQDVGYTLKYGMF
ncbi:hypothetical protein PAXRUDRAFT_211564 [Paxillus rubicundulus Ve08.2h10]|uniref:Uncharacterized protein n=1 Tax=Paxillus rubicundulus Ve08.2h10 TaxID=930991 RepID=A0A0D0E7C3_9AGAM|nr:hypothetical protein PAXRUDRAFT_211564 [Paxillus rubicundulus Ve08.2h10]